MLDILQGANVRNRTRRNAGAIVVWTCMVSMLLVVGCSQKSGETTADKSDVEEKGTAMSAEQGTEDALEIAFNTIEGQPSKLANYAGEVVLVVNVASECGYTPQYEGLQALYQRYQERGLTVLGFPANNFGKQEPGSDEEIHKFCQSKFSVTFPMMSKVSVKGDDQHPLFAYLTAHSDPSGEIPWNFHKFLLDRKGNIVARFEPGVKPLSEELTSKIESLL